MSVYNFVLNLSIHHKDILKVDPTDTYPKVAAICHIRIVRATYFTLIVWTNFKSSIYQALFFLITSTLCTCLFPLLAAVLFQVVIQDAAERTPLFEKRINSKPKKIQQIFFYFWKAHRMPFYINVFLNKSSLKWRR